MAKKMIYKTVYTVTVLSEEPISYSESNLSNIANQIREGDWVGTIEYSGRNAPLIGKEAVEEVNARGSQPQFFNMDENGNELEN